MDKRLRVLVVEDVDTMRDSHIDNLLLEQYCVDGASSLDDAKAALDRRSYHVALVDIMLGGERDFANRDGVKVLEHIQALGEGTQAIVVSRQDEVQRVRDFIKQYGAFDYLAKVELERLGISHLLAMVKSAAAASPAGHASTWEELAMPLSSGSSEAFLVSDCLGRLRIKGGFEHFSRSLLNVGKHLLPLLVRKGNAPALVFHSADGVFRGEFWSKGQGEAIELFIAGPNGVPAESLKQARILENVNTGGLSICVTHLPGRTLEDFEKKKREKKSEKSDAPPFEV